MKSTNKKSALYLILTVVAFALLGFGGYLIRLGGVLNIIGGLLLSIIGFIIGVVLYGDNWGSWI